MITRLKSRGLAATAWKARFPSFNAMTMSSENREPSAPYRPLFRGHEELVHVTVEIQHCLDYESVAVHASRGDFRLLDVAGLTAVADLPLPFFREPFFGSGIVYGLPSLKLSDSFSVVLPFANVKDDIFETLDPNSQKSFRRSFSNAQTRHLAARHPGHAVGR